MLTKRRREAVVRDWRRRHQTGSDDESLLAPEAQRVRPGRHRAPAPQLPLTGEALAAFPTRWIGVAGTLASIAACLIMGAAPTFRIADAAVVGAARLSTSDVVQVAGVIGQSAFRIDPADAVRRLSALPDVEAASVAVRLPRTLVIGLRETVPVATWHSGGMAFAIDEHARAIPMPVDTANLPRILDHTRQVSSLGDRLPDGLLEAALAFTPVFGQLALEADHGFVATTAEGWPVWLGVDSRRAAEQAAMLEGLRRSSLRPGAELQYVDLRPVTRPYFRLKGGE